MTATLTLTPEVLEDETAVSLALSLAAANKRAREIGLNANEDLVGILYLLVDGADVWEVSYGPRNCFDQRGGGLIIEVNAQDNSIRRVLRGQ